jgi:hypothetical protein
MAMETRPKGKSFWMLSFATQVARGIIREQRVRRTAMFVIILLAMLMLFAGTTFLQDTLDHHVHAAWFIFYWLACGWLTVTALMLALFDMLIVRAQLRAARKLFEKDLAASRELQKRGED